jgi:hypothetical protein
LPLGIPEAPTASAQIEYMDARGGAALSTGLMNMGSLSFFL